MDWWVSLPNKQITVIHRTVLIAHLRNKSGMHSTGPFILQEMAKQGIPYILQGKLYSSFFARYNVLRIHDK